MQRRSVHLLLLFVLVGCGIGDERCRSAGGAEDEWVHRRCRCGPSHCRGVGRGVRGGVGVRLRAVGAVLGQSKGQPLGVLLATFLFLATTATEAAYGSCHCRAEPTAQSKPQRAHAAAADGRPKRHGKLRALCVSAGKALRRDEMRAANSPSPSSSSGAVVRRGRY